MGKKDNKQTGTKKTDSRTCADVDKELKKEVWNIAYGRVTNIAKLQDLVAEHDRLLPLELAESQKGDETVNENKQTG